MVILGRIKEGVVYLATDTRELYGAVKKQYLEEFHYKIRRKEGGLLVGIAVKKPCVRQAIASYDDMFTLDKNGDLTKEHIVKEIVPKLRQVCEQEGFLPREKEQAPYIEAEIILAHKGKMFTIRRDFTVVRHAECAVVGPVCAFALYAVSQESDDVNGQLLKGLQVATEHANSVAPPYLFINTKDLTYQLIGGDVQ